jgi:hypothetical protein
MEEKLRERVPIAEWPDLERKMAIISRMSSDPPIKKLENDIPVEMENISLHSKLSDSKIKR